MRENFMENQVHLYDDLVNAAIDDLNTSGVYWFFETRLCARALCNRVNEVLEGRLILCHELPPEWEFVLVDDGVHSDALDWIKTVSQQRSDLRNVGYQEDKLPRFPRNK